MLWAVSRKIGGCVRKCGCSVRKINVLCLEVCLAMLESVVRCVKKCGGMC